MEEGSPGLGCLRIRRKPPGGPIGTSPGSQGSGCRVTGVLNIGFHFAQFCTHGGINRAEISALSLLPTDPEKQEVKPTSGISRIIKCSVCPCTLCTLCLERGTSECPSRDSFTDEQAPTSPRRGGRVSQRPHSTASILRCLHGKVFRLLIPGFTASSRFRERLLGVHLPCEVYSLPYVKRA